MQRKTAIYLHGFNSAFTWSDKPTTLAKYINLIGVNYDSFASYNQAIEQLITMIDDAIDLHDRDHLVAFFGTSLGGFYAFELGRIFRRPSVLFNPCISPAPLLKLVTGVTMTNFVTSERNTVAAGIADSYHGITVCPTRATVKPLILVDLADPVINAKQTIAAVGDHFPVVAFEGGNHHFQHIEQSIDHIIQYLVQTNV